MVLLVLAVLGGTLVVLVFWVACDLGLVLLPVLASAFDLGFYLALGLWHHLLAFVVDTMLFVLLRMRESASNLEASALEGARKRQ